MTLALFDRLEQLRLIPIVTIDDARHAEPLADALVRGGLPCAEVTFRTDAAARAIRAMTQRGNLLVGAGTVLLVDQVKVALDAGAQFVVTPGLHPKVVNYCLERSIPIAPGVATATDIAWALDRGLRVVKFFPAEALGGSRGLKALCAAYPMMRFIPTGGIHLSCVREYLRMPEVLACGGSWLASADLYASGDYDAVARVVREAVSLVRHDGAS
ncbi:MAG: bifunctional 4-hydroxy-2-oxoglutarate aldolase/2-dehydro-3-deoxy-phosphogluconate aldolase [Phycisphaerales bacterium]|nr:MAG: bifunctional 4-hydroxy-2-oxoglutarate aldolase/2-dehydro-3-deoxy-phosphogluconate aldolase [Phycisphaerales bacterium]